MLPIDSIFTPVTNVIYEVEPFRVGQKTDYEKLVLDVSTNGIISAKESVHIASKILNDHIRLFLNLDEFEMEEINSNSDLKKSLKKGLSDVKAKKGKFVE